MKQLHLLSLVVVMLLAALNADRDATPEQTLKNVRGAVDAFVKDAEQFDDLTMLCLEYKGGGV